MTKWNYHLVDVFTDEPFGGNPLAVFPDGGEVPEALFQRIAKEINLSETTFVLPPETPGCDFKVRIFTPRQELPMAGHPTLGTAFVLAREGRLPPEGNAAPEGKAPLKGDAAQVVFQEGVGPIPVSLALDGGQPGLITMQQPLPEFGKEAAGRGAVAEALSLQPGQLADGLPCQAVSCGVPYLIVPLNGLAAVAQAHPRAELLEPVLKEAGAHATLIFTRETGREGSDVHARMFAPGFGILEDPATGSAAGPLGCYLAAREPEGAGPLELICEQGFEMERPSLLHIAIEREQGTISAVRVGGRCVHMGGGWFQLP